MFSTASPAVLLSHFRSPFRLQLMTITYPLLLVLQSTYLQLPHLWIGTIAILHAGRPCEQRNSPTSQGPQRT